MNPDLDLNNWLESVWSPDFFENIVMATNNAIMQEGRVFRQIASTRPSWAAAVNANTIDQAS